MVDVTAQAEVFDVDRLGRVLAALQEHTGRDAFQAVMFASVRLCESGRAGSKAGRKTREVVQNPVFKMNKRERALLDMSDAKQNWMAQYRWMIAIDTQARGRRWWYTHDRNDPKAAVPRYALASKVWHVLAARAASTKGQTYNPVDYGSFAAFQNEHVSVATINNALTYLDEAYPGLRGHIMQAATKKLEMEAGLRVRRTTARVNSGAAL